MGIILIKYNKINIILIMKSNYTALSPIPNPQSPIPNPQSPIPNIYLFKYNNKYNYKIIFQLNLNIV